MVWGMSIPSNFGEFWPDGDFEGLANSGLARVADGFCLMSGWAVVVGKPLSFDRVTRQ
jgi:hypothetical protein